MAFWPQKQHDLVVISFDAHGTDDGIDITRILRRQANGDWLSDCRHAKVQYSQAESEGENFGSRANEIPPHPYRFPSGEVALLYAASNNLFILPASQTEPLCNLKGLRQPQTLRTLAKLGPSHILLVNSTGDLDIFECPSGRHIVSGAMLDDELVVYTDQGWFDGSAEAASFVQLRLPGVEGRFPLSQFEGALRRPGIFKDAIEGKTLPPININSPPYVHLNSITKAWRPPMRRH